jgi:hypothetical protein
MARDMRDSFSCIQRFDSTELSEAEQRCLKKCFVKFSDVERVMLLALKARASEAPTTQ